ncbi:hypothetical protein RFI_09910, partial [Reticulomyxa filosa]
RISTLETEVGEVQRERDALTLRLDSVLYELKTVQDLYCLDQLQGQSAVDESSFFPKQQSIIETYQSFVNIYHSKLHQSFGEKLKLKYSNTNNDNKFELFIDYIGYEFLYHIMINCYSKMKQRKDLFIQAAAELLQMSPQAAATTISTAMQRCWKLYIGNTYNNVYTDEVVPEEKQQNHLIQSQFSLSSIDKMIVEMTDLAIANYGDWTFLTEFWITFFYKKKKKKNISKHIPETRNALEVFIAKCCEVCWLMTLLKPSALLLYPLSPDVNTLSNSTAVEKKSLNKTLSFAYGSVDTCDNVLYYAIPAVVVDGTNEVLYPATAFTHKDEEVFNAISLFMKNEHKTATKNSLEAPETQKSAGDGSNDEWTDLGNQNRDEPESEMEITDNKNSP